MKVEAFIPDWRSPKCDAGLLRKHLEQCCKVTILDAYDVPFTEQWKEAVSKFKGDIFIWAMADTRVHNFPYLYSRMLEAYRFHGAGIYAPNVNYTSQIYNRQKLFQVAPDLYEVNGTDLVFVTMARHILEETIKIAMPSTRGWGYDYLLSAVTKDIGAKILRDYSILIDHPEGSVYGHEIALKEQQEWFNKLPLKWQEDIKWNREEQARLCA